jgi:co-chaperonin GroES (HSP10)
MRQRVTRTPTAKTAPTIEQLKSLHPGPIRYDIESDQWRPIRDYLLVKQDEVHVMPSGILVVPPKGIVESQKQWGHTGTVLAAGPGLWVGFGKKQQFLETTVKPGDRIVWGEFLPSAIVEHNGERCIVIREQDVCGIIEEQEAA